MLQLKKNENHAHSSLRCKVFYLEGEQNRRLFAVMNRHISFQDSPSSFVTSLPPRTHENWPMPRSVLNLWLQLDSWKTSQFKLPWKRLYQSAKFSLRLSYVKGTVGLRNIAGTNFSHAALLTWAESATSIVSSWMIGCRGKPFISFQYWKFSIPTVGAFSCSTWSALQGSASSKRLLVSCLPICWIAQYRCTQYYLGLYTEASSVRQFEKAFFWSFACVNDSYFFADRGKVWIYFSEKWLPRSFSRWRTIRTSAVTNSSAAAVMMDVKELAPKRDKSM